MNRIASGLHRLVRRAPPFRGKGRLLKALLRQMDVADSFYGPRLTVRPHDKTFLATYFGRYGSELVQWIERLPPTGVFLEFGANTGVFSLVAGRHLRSGMAYAIEPNPFVFRDLINNIHLNGADNVYPLNFAIGSATRMSSFAFSSDHTGKGFIGSEKASDSACSIVLLDALQLPGLLPDLSDRQCLCKIDTEGAELSILKSLIRSNLIAGINVFYVEIDEDNLSRFGAASSEIYDLLALHSFLPQTERRGRGHYDEIFIRA